MYIFYSYHVVVVLMSCIFYCTFAVLSPQAGFYYPTLHFISSSASHVVTSQQVFVYSINNSYYNLMVIKIIYGVLVQPSQNQLD